MPSSAMDVDGTSAAGVSGQAAEKSANIADATVEGVAEGLHPSIAGCIDRLEVENFKSYRGRQAIGPFKAFTAVIGPNGSGKSNLMDAISFVLGVKTAQLRGSLKELLYAHSGGGGPAAPDAGGAGPSTSAACDAAPFEKPRRGFVKLVFVLYGSGEEVAFSRHIQPQSAAEPDSAPYVSVYKINDKTVTFDAYCARLSSFGVLVKVRNFLVFQGDIEAVAAKSPMGLTTLFEQISGSDALKKEYEQLDVAKTKAEEKVSLLFARKKAVGAERKAKKEQKEAVEKHLALVEDARAVKCEHVLWQLQCLRREIKERRAERKKAQEALHAVAAENMKFDSEVEALRKVAAGLAKERLLLEKKVKKLQADRDRKTPKLLAAKEEATRVTKRLKVDDKEVADVSGRLDTSATHLKRLGKDLKKIQAAEVALAEEEAAHRAQHLGEALNDPAVMEEYTALKNEIGAKTAKAKGERDMLTAEQQADEQQLAQLSASAAQMNSRLDSLQAQLAESGAKAEAGTAELLQLRAELKVKSAEKLNVADERTQSTARREYLERKLGELDAALHEEKAHRSATQKEEKMAAAVETLKQLFPGVYGRLPELGRITHRRYNLAMTVAMGRDFDSVICDTEATAKACIAHLKEIRKPPLTFIPLNYCKVKPLNERLRSLGSNIKLAVDMVEAEPRFQRAFLFALGNTLLCETIEEANNLALSGSERHKVVSLDGTSFTKAGLITGGSEAGAGGLGAKAGRWDEKVVAEKRQEREGILQLLTALPTHRSLSEAESVLAQEVAALEARIKYTSADVATTKEKIKRLEGEIARASADIERRQPEMDALQVRIDERAVKIQVITTRIHEVTDRVFRKLSSRLGVGSIREYEEQADAFNQASNTQRVELAQQKAKVVSQLDYEKEQRPKLEASLARAREQTAKDSAVLAKLQEEAAALQGMAAEADAQMSELQSQLGALTAQVDKAEDDLKDKRASAVKLNTDGSKLKRAVTTADAALEAVAVRIHDVIEAAALEQVPLPRKEGTAEPMEIDDEEAGTSAEGQESAEAAAAKALATLNGMDFSGVKRAHDKAHSVKEKEAVEAEFRERITEMSVQIEKSAPNMKAVEQYEAIKEKEKEQTEALQAARADSTAANEAFNRVSSRRHDLFTRAFEHISAQIDVIYKDLTRSSVHQLGGSAYLHLESEDSTPYLGGIKFTAIPPTKRFRDMEQLSGGEKTVAALALLFAIHSYRPSPFFVLDEVDAALDATNVARVAHYIRAKTREGRADAFQSIVISLKDLFYEKADALVGVCRDLDGACSKTFTFDLNRFEEPARDV